MVVQIYFCFGGDSGIISGIILVLFLKTAGTASMLGPVYVFT